MDPTVDRVILISFPILQMLWCYFSLLLGKCYILLLMPSGGDKYRAMATYLGLYNCFLYKVNAICNFTKQYKCHVMILKVLGKSVGG